MVASYIVTFLKPEMQHVYRQLTSLRRWRTEVWCQKVENAERFPFQSVHVLRKPLTHQVRRWWQKSVQGGPIIMYRGEARRLLGQIEKAGARVLHVYFGHMGVHLLPVLEMAKIPVVVSFHGADAQVDLDKPKFLEATRKVFTLAKLLVVRSHSLKAKLVGAGCDEAKIRIQRAGVPLKDIPFRQREVPADGAWRCVQAGRLIEKKGLGTSLRAFAEFSKTYPKSTLTLAGDGELRADLWSLAQKLGVAERVKFTGFLGQSELRALYAGAHVFMHPSQIGKDGNQEGVPNSMLEAMASGLPILATTHGGIPEAVVHGESGLLVAERDHAALAAEMLALAGDPARFTTMSKVAAEHVARTFEIGASAAVLEGIYDEAVGRE